MVRFAPKNACPKQESGLGALNWPWLAGGAWWGLQLEKSGQVLSRLIKACWAGSDEITVQQESAVSSRQLVSRKRARGGRNGQAQHNHGGLDAVKSVLVVLVLCPLTSGQLNDVVGMYIRTRALLTLTVHVDHTRQLRQGAQRQSIWPHWKPCITLKLIA